MGLSDIPANYMQGSHPHLSHHASQQHHLHQHQQNLHQQQLHNAAPTPAQQAAQVLAMESNELLMSTKEKLSSKKKMHLLKKIKKRFGLVRRSPSSCPGPNNLPPLQFHSVHGDNIRISRDGTLARRFESFCRAITFSARPVRINERICVKFAEISNNWNGGIRFGFTSNDPATLEGSLPKYACPDLTNRPGFWAKALHEQYCEKDNILYYYVNGAGDVIYGINNEEKGVILSGIDTRALLWTVIDIYGNCTGIEFLDSRIYMYQQQPATMALTTQPAPAQLQQLAQPAVNTASTLNPHHPHQQSRRSLPGHSGAIEHELERHVMPSLQSLHLAGNANGTVSSVEQAAIAHDLANGLPPLRYNANGRLIPVPFHNTKGRNVRLSHDRFVASRTESDFCQGYVFTARPIRIGEKLIVQVLKTEQMYVGALALGLTSCNPAMLQPNDLPNDSDFLLDRPEYWVVSKDIAAAPQRGDEIAFFVAPNGEVSISKNNGPAVVVMHVDQSLQLWAFLDVYGSTQSLRMFRQQLPNMVAYPSQPQVNVNASSSSACAASTSRMLPMTESMSSLNAGATAKLLHHPSQLSIAQSTSTLASAGGANGSRMISMPSNGDILQIQPNGGGTVLVVNLPPASSSHDINGQINARPTATVSSSGILAGACSGGTLISTTSSQYIEPVANSTNNAANKWKDSLSDQQSTDSGAECTICYENPIDSVLYMCGHMCMCYDCAIEQWRGVGGGQCPLCRAVIRDVIRTYTT
ncbi:protein neuralized isoform X1 [Drosophila bipectinata]|uniref:protein neuralized isoform X1 n=1 Tax=Drosophila bipectinata TaxID=42026 RepID=UPI001C8B07FD|nr:protein neuralized isoform X1 [Drosophila bipectinata]